MSGPRFRPEEAAAALERAHGDRIAAGRAIGCSQTTIGRYIARFPEVREAAECGQGIANRRRWPRYSVKQVAAAVEHAWGNKAAVARAVGCSRETVRRYIARYAPVREAYERAYRERLKAGRGRIPPPDKRGVFYSEQEMARALTQARGLVSVAARALHCDAQTVYSHIQRSPAVRQAYEEARASMIDLVENRLAEAVEGGKMQAVCYALSRLGAGRGYRRKGAKGRKGPDDETMAEFEAALEEAVARRTGQEGREGEDDEPGN